MKEVASESENYHHTKAMGVDKRREEYSSDDRRMMGLRETAEWKLKDAADTEAKASTGALLLRNRRTQQIHLPSPS